MYHGYREGIFLFGIRDHARRSKKAQHHRGIDAPRKAPLSLLSCSRGDDKKETNVGNGGAAKSAKEKGMEMAQGRKRMRKRRRKREKERYES